MCQEVKIIGQKNIQDKKTTEALLQVNDLSVHFSEFKQGFNETANQVINKFDITVQKGEVIGVVGASGAGKSLLADAILGILPNHAQTNGSIYFKGEKLSEQAQAQLRGREIILIPQSVQALDPLMKAGQQVALMIKEKDKKSRVKEIFKQVGLHERVANLYPYELSGGMARRVLISIAIASDADLIIADESTPGLDDHVKNDTIKLLKRLAKQGKGIVFITHDISAAIQIAHKITVVYEGETIETAHVENFTGAGEKLVHPYTKALWNALPENNFIHSFNKVNVKTDSI